METVIVAIIVAAAASWAGWRLFARRRGTAPGCASGCGGCSCAAHPQPVAVKGQRLVRIQRR
jgi:hypothetical protein